MQTGTVKVITFSGETGDFSPATVELEHTGMASSMLEENTCQPRVVEAETFFKNEFGDYIKPKLLHSKGNYQENEKAT